eukprot:CAMPEP_0117037442 /NCGR_PEP_ID=MMETSP0472-20121206/26430_1 /TAXON_ID=693140 ORGANISM="Tiarina fusus, Strain LIS" /NCGR_SAMPLE_ID=MMETSP0472 /ASSEMBLY_ACC=CAM_ASM_000603 /LENGTH=100 /DNA_ID=CAMNT_0004747431 /DNA_START=204 /DNA_END=502 /DNA_ORIENTATION=+
MSVDLGTDVDQTAGKEKKEKEKKDSCCDCFANGCCDGCCNACDSIRCCVDIFRVGNTAARGVTSASGVAGAAESGTAALADGAIVTETLGATGSAAAESG